MTSDLRALLSTHSDGKRTKYFDLSEQYQGYTLPTETIEGKRYYVTPDGNKYPSVTTVLSSMNASAIAEWRQRVGHEEANKISTQASTRGTKVHLIAEKYLANDDNYAADAMPSNVVMFNQIKEYLDGYCDKVYASEIALYSDKLKTAGRCDLIARVHDLRTVCDFKTAKRHKKEEWITNYFFQCTAYAMMLFERQKLWCPQICLMIATEEEGLQTFVRQTGQYTEQVEKFFDQYHKKTL